MLCIQHFKEVLCVRLNPESGFCKANRLPLVTSPVSATNFLSSLASGVLLNLNNDRNAQVS